MSVKYFMMSSADSEFEVFYVASRHLQFYYTAYLIKNITALL